MDATVLLAMDVQRGVIERFASDPGYLPPAAAAERWAAQLTAADLTS